jgi:hypothetical protein
MKSNQQQHKMDAITILDTALDQVRSDSNSSNGQSTQTLTTKNHVSQVTRLQENVNQAVLPASGLEAVQSLGVSCCCSQPGCLLTSQQTLLTRSTPFLQNAQQNLDRLQQLAAQLQKLAAAVQSATPPVAQPGKGQQEAWVSGLQDQAKQAAAALQQQVSAALSGPSPGLLRPVQQSPQHTHMQPQDYSGDC